MDPFISLEYTCGFVFLLPYFVYIFVKSELCKRLGAGATEMYEIESLRHRVHREVGGLIRKPPLCRMEHILMKVLTSVGRREAQEFFPEEVILIWVCKASSG